MDLSQRHALLTYRRKLSVIWPQQKIYPSLMHAVDYPSFLHRSLLLRSLIPMSLLLTNPFLLIINSIFHLFHIPNKFKPILKILRAHKTPIPFLLNPRRARG
jgi:hypothetical protein